MSGSADLPFDAGTFSPHADELTTSDPIAFPGYTETLEKAHAHSGVDEAVVCGGARIAGHDVEVALFNFDFIGGSMGEVAGERLARAMERAAARQVPFILGTKTGGARMQEGMRALVQMAKVVSARIELESARCPFVAILGDPTTGGVLASVAASADFILAEEGATIGFAGPRVAAAHLGHTLNADSHTAQSALAAGLVDTLVAPEEVVPELRSLIGLLGPEDPSPTTEPPVAGGTPLSGWDAVQRARAPSRPIAPELARAIGEGSFELRGDRAGTDDRALVALLTRIGGRRAVVLALDRAHSPGPGAYRKARRCVALAGRLELPVVTLIDTRGADPSERSENAGVAWEISQLFHLLLSVPVPILSVVTGEGGSGGALAFAVGDTLLAYEASIFSVISPELAATILWREAERAPEAAEALRLSAQDLLALGIADEVIPEPLDASTLRAAVAYHLGRLSGADEDLDRIDRRRRRWRRSG